MFRLSPVRLWRTISIIMFLTAILFTLIGTFAVRGNVVIHWNSAGIPNNAAGKWILWAMLLLAFLSMFTHGSFSKRRVGKNPLSTEMSGALSSGLVSTWTITNIILVTYHLHPSTMVPAIGTIIIIFCYFLFVIIAYIRNRRNMAK